MLFVKALLKMLLLYCIFLRIKIKKKKRFYLRMRKRRKLSKFIDLDLLNYYKMEDFYKLWVLGRVRFIKKIKNKKEAKKYLINLQKIRKKNIIMFSRRISNICKKQNENVNSLKNFNDWRLKRIKKTVLKNKKW